MIEEPHLPTLSALGEREIECFRRNGFVIIERCLTSEQVETFRASFPKLFAGRFDTGVYPDGVAAVGAAHWL
jgi:phytanoyl-CoA hydroxylase